MAKNNYSYQNNFENKIAIVTGGASGLGKAISTALIKAGSKVVLVDKNQKALDSVARELGENAEAKVADVSIFESMKTIVDEAVKKYGKLDYIFNNAGVTVIGEARDIAIEDWTEVINTNLMGVVNGVAAAYPIMVDQKSGHIVNTSSMAGLIPAGVPYTTSKFGVVGLSHALRVEGRQLGVKVSVVCPACIDTPIWMTAKIVRSKIKTPKESVKLYSWKPKFMDADTAAEIVLKGVSKNRATILTHPIWRVVLLCYVLLPKLYFWIYDVYVVRRFRSQRI